MSAARFSAALEATQAEGTEDILRFYVPHIVLPTPNPEHLLPGWGADIALKYVMGNGLTAKVTDAARSITCFTAIGTPAIKLIEEITAADRDEVRRLSVRVEDLYKNRTPSDTVIKATVYFDLALDLHGQPSTLARLQALVDEASGSWQPTPRSAVR